MGSIHRKQVFFLDRFFALTPRTVRMLSCDIGVHIRPMVRRTWVMGWVGLLLSCFCLCDAVSAADATPQIENVKIGFRGIVEVGRWTPIVININGPVGKTVSPRVTACDIEGRPVQWAATPVTLASESTTVTMVYQHGPIETLCVVELVEDGRVIDQKTIHPSRDAGSFETVPQNTDLVLCLGDAVVGMEQAAQAATEIRRTRPERVAPLSVQNYSEDQFGELVKRVQGWEAVDVVVVTAQCHIPDDLGTVLLEWVEQGGRLVLLGGEQVTSVDSPGLQAWNPLHLKGGLAFRDLTSLNRAIPGSPTLRLREGNLRAVHWEADKAAVLSESLDGPIVVRAGLGLGTVTAIALDLNDLPFARVTGDERSVAWDSLADLCRWLSGMEAIPQLEESSQRPQSDLNPTGVSDLQTQLVNTLDRFPEVQRPSYWLVLGAILVFIALVGPLDYLVIHRVLKRPHWTWFTLPVWIAVGTLIGLQASNRLTGPQHLSRQLDVVTWDAVQGETQLDSWLSIYSSTHHRFAVECRPGGMTTGASSATQVRWGGRPEAGFRGLYRTPASNRGAALEFAPGSSQLQSLPIRQGGSVTLEAKSLWPEQLPMTFDLTDNGDGHLLGTIQHQLDGELVDWVLAYRNFAYLPTRNSAGVDQPLKPGQSIKVDSIPSRLLVDFLVGRGSRSVQRADRKSVDYVVTREGYDPLGRDLHSVLRALTFHRIVETQNFTELKNSTLQTEDLSRLVDSNRAVVFGRWRNSSYLDPETPVEGPEGATGKLAADYTIDGQTNIPRYRECFVRWVLPVRQPGTDSPPQVGQAEK